VRIEREIQAAFAVELSYGYTPIGANIFSAYVRFINMKAHPFNLSHRNRLMTKDPLTSTREALIKDTDHLKRDAGHIVENVKKHASAHVDAVKDR